MKFDRRYFLRAVVGAVIARTIPLGCGPEHVNFVQACLTETTDGAFLVAELERLDSTPHEPLAAVTWSRDMLEEL